MKKFNSDLLRCEYVKVKKITPTYLYITKTIDGKAFKNKNAKIGTYKNQKVYKLKIHNSVSSAYFKNNSMVEFKFFGINTCIAFYDDVVLSFDVQRYTNNSDPYENTMWVSVLDSILSNIEDCIPNDRTVYINGKEIIWKSTTKNVNLPIDPDNHFFIKSVDYLSLAAIGKMINVNSSNTEDNKNISSIDFDNENEFDINTVSVGKIIKRIGFSNGFTSTQIKTLDFSTPLIEESELNTDTNTTVQKAVAFVRNSFSLFYYPDGQNDINDDFFVFSPILFDTATDKSDAIDKKLKVITSFLTNINQDDDPTYLNLNFLLDSGQVIGQLYGIEETEFLNIEDVILESKVVCLSKISKDSKNKYPLSMHPFVGLAWLFKFIYKEEDLDNLRILSNLMTKVFSTGFVKRSTFADLFKDGKSETDIKMKHYESVF